ncbi:MAG: hypothetical protein A2Z20_12865 [Bdellovibrionales bacterium RBG_16_40_8]|nr:MAG: hypothetical protein A2Z20_12865 [Bdellovibrionales bacterium RBG_16_40_8]
MSRVCPSKSISCREFGRIVRFGHYFRKSDKKWIQRYRCTHCGGHFSQATSSPCYDQNKRHLNRKIYLLLVSGVSQRRIAHLLKTHTITVARKLKFLGLQARYYNLCVRRRAQLVRELQFDDLETIEHTKLKPLSVTLAVEKHTRRILGFEVSRMPAKGLLSKNALKKYGPRIDKRFEGRDRLFRRIKDFVAKDACIESDENPHYLWDVKRHFPDGYHHTLKGQRGCVTGQGELKKIGFDPLFSLNHTCAMLRANINRLFRKTWCTTKKIHGLIDHLEIYVQFHNQVLIKRHAD